MKIKVGEIVASRESLAKLIGKELPVKAAFRLSRVVKTLNTELKDFEEQRMKLIQKYGEKKEGQEDTMIVKPENMEAFSTEMEALFTEEIEVSYEPVTVADLGNVQITPSDMVALEKFIVE
jgi:hypothetical protein